MLKPGTSYIPLVAEWAYKSTICQTVQATLWYKAVYHVFLGVALSAALGCSNFVVVVLGQPEVPGDSFREREGSQSTLLTVRSPRMIRRAETCCMARSSPTVHCLSMAHFGHTGPPERTIKATFYVISLLLFPSHGPCVFGRIPATRVLACLALLYAFTMCTMYSMPSRDWSNETSK